MINIEKYMILDYVGSPYKTNNKGESESLKRNMLEGYDEFRLNKLEFLNECYENEKTRVTYWTLYKTNILIYEQNMNKDLMFFSTEDIHGMLNSLIYSYNTTRDNISSFINNYCRWAEKRGYIKINPMVGLNKNDIRINSNSFIKNKIYGKNEFYNMIRKMSQDTNIQNLLPLILARYGIIGINLNQMSHLRWEDINYNTMEVNIICDNETIKKLPVDKEFLSYIDKAKLFEGDSFYKYTNCGYVLKKANNGRRDLKKVVGKNTIFNRVNECCKVLKMPRIPFKSLLLSRQMEVLVDIRKQKRLAFSDFEYVVSMFDFEGSDNFLNRAFQLKKRWIELTGDEVYTARKSTRNLTDDNSYQISEEISKKYDLYL